MPQTPWKKEQVVILCGGEGTRMREETEFKPKALVEIGGRPILWHLMRIYYRWGYRRFVIALGYKGEHIKDYFLNYRSRYLIRGGPGCPNRGIDFLSGSLRVWHR